MMNPLTILTTIDKEEYDIVGKNRDNDLADFIVSLKENVYSDYGTNYYDGGCGSDGEINYIDNEIELDLSRTSDDVILGMEQPDKLLKIVKAWNPEIMERTYKALLIYQGKADAAGVNLAEYFKHIPADELAKTYRIADVRDAFEELSGKFCYGQNKLVYGAELNLKVCIGYFNGTVIHEELLNDVMKHPEAYALITVYYD